MIRMAACRVIQRWFRRHSMFRNHAALLWQRAWFRAKPGRMLRHLQIRSIRARIDVEVRGTERKTKALLLLQRRQLRLERRRPLRSLARTARRAAPHLQARSSSGRRSERALARPHEAQHSIVCRLR